MANKHIPATRSEQLVLPLIVAVLMTAPAVADCFDTGEFSNGSPWFTSPLGSGVDVRIDPTDSIWVDTDGDGEPDTLNAMGNLGDLYTSLDRYAEAETLLVAAVETVRRTLPREHVATGYTLRKYGRLLVKTARYDVAEESLIEAHGIVLATAGPDHAHTKRAADVLVELYETQGRESEAESRRFPQSGP